MKILDKILLWILKNRLERFKKDAEWYEKEENKTLHWIDDNGNYTDFYHTTGIPNLKKQIKELERKICTLISRKKHIL